MCGLEGAEVRGTKQKTPSDKSFNGCIELQLILQRVFDAS